MSVKSVIGRIAEYYKLPKELIAMGVFVAGLGSFVGGVVIGDAVNAEGGEQESEEQVEKYQQKISVVAGMETKIFKLQKAVDNAEMNALLDDDAAAPMQRIEKAKALISTDQKNLKMRIESLSQEMLLDKVLPEKNFADVVKEFDESVEAELPEYLAKVYPLGLRECQGEAASGAVMAQCTVDRQNETIMSIGGMTGAFALAVFLGLPFAHRRKEQEAEKPAAEKPVTTMLKVTYTK